MNTQVRSINLEEFRSQYRGNRFCRLIRHHLSRQNQHQRIQSVRFPWPSALVLIYPISVTVYFASCTPASPTVGVGYGLANLGYLLFASGIWAGSFAVFGLKKRWQVFALAAVSLAAGTVLSTVGV